MSDEPWTIGRLLTWTTEWLGGKGSESPRLDAEVLLAHVRGCPRIMLYAAFDQEIAEEPRARFRELVRRRAAGEPVAYLVGHREFFSLPFAVSPDVLVPRPETETLVSRVIDLCKDSHGTKLVDVGTGSGAIAVTLAKHLPRSLITATDSSPAALAVAEANAERQGVADRVSFMEADLLDDPKLVGPWDVIVSNPPYVKESEFAALPRDVRDHEPRSALVAGPRGTELIERLAAAARERLMPGGWLVVEAGPFIAVEVGEILAGSEHLEPGPVINDLAGLPRVFQARRR